jgi:PIN domain nuclease of toxin-antitoxin system
VKLLLDTHLLIWAASAPERLSKQAASLIQDPRNDLLFSAVSLWEIVIKSTGNWPDFSIDAARLRRGMIDSGYSELAVTAAHTLGVASLPPIHKDPFDRLLLAQAATEGFLFLTSDKTLATYPGPVKLV